MLDGDIDTYLSDVVEAVEDVLARLLALDACLQLVLLRRLQSPERIRAVHVTVEELGCFTRAGTNKPQD